jgi:hypothetical protein
VSREKDIPDSSNQAKGFNGRNILFFGEISIILI